MSWLRKKFFKNELDDFKVKVLYNIKSATLFMIIPLAFMYYIDFNGEKGIAVAKNLYGNSVDKACSLDSNYFVAKGVVPLKESNFLIKLFYYKGTTQSHNKPEWTFIDFLGIVTLLVLIHFFIRNTINYGPFDKRTTYYLKWSMFISIGIFFIKIGLLIFIEFYFRNIVELKDRVDTTVYGGQGWIYTFSIYGFILNIFNYGRKLQEDVDLTV